MQKHFLTMLVGLLAVVLQAGPPASAQDFPSKPIRIIAPFAPGGSPDVISRIIAEEMKNDVGQPVVVENRPGAGGNLAAEYVLRQEPDGHTLFLGTTGNMAANKSIFKKLPFDPETDFAPLTLVYASTNVLLVRKDSGMKSIKDVIDRAKAKPGSITYGSPGVGTAGHLIGGVFAARAGIEIKHVAYKGQAQVIADLRGGHIDISFEAIATAIQAIKSGDMIGLAIATKERNAKLPDVPTFQESGFKDFAFQAWAIMAASSKTPPAIAQRLNAALVKAINSKPVREKVDSLGVQVGTSSIEDAKALLKAEVALWRDVVKTTGFKPLD